MNITNKSLLIYLTSNINSKLNLLNFILLIAFTKKSNLSIHILDSVGKELLFYSIGSVGLKKKYNQRTEILNSYLERIAINLDKLRDKPVTVHVLNISNNLSWFFNKLANIVALININLIYSFSYNGCRRKKK